MGKKEREPVHSYNGQIPKAIQESHILPPLEDKAGQAKLPSHSGYLGMKVIF